MKTLKKYTDFVNEYNEFGVPSRESEAGGEEDGMMNDAEVKEDVLRMINDLKSSTNSWSSRDTLKHFTSYGFWSGDEMASIDIETADDIARELYDYVEDKEPGHWAIEEVYGELYKR